MNIWKKLIGDSADRELKALSKIDSAQSFMESRACKTNDLQKLDFNLLISGKITGLVR